MLNKEGIKRVEKKWLKILFAHLRNEFSKNPVPSHDHTHHYRVWLLAKEVIELLNENGFIFSFSDLEKIIISVFFHDIGLTVTHDPSHGKESRVKCEKFLSNNKLFHENMNDLLFAIENHDEKTYLKEKSEKINSVYSILTISDDLDAYGAIGVYRYLEIYSMRKIPIPENSEKVLENLSGRFNYFENQFGNFEYFFEKHKERQQFTYNFYSNTKNNFNAKVIDLLHTNVIHPKKNIDAIFKQLDADDLHQNYFTRLKNELNYFKILEM